MPTMRTLLILGSLLALNATAGAETPRALRDYLGPQYESLGTGTPSPEAVPPRFGVASETLRRWNRIAVDASGLDHTAPAAGEDRVFGEQLGPGRSSRAIAIVHIAIFDAVNAIVGGYQSYAGILPAPRWASIDAAIAQAAHDTLVRVFPSQRKQFDELLDENLKQIGGNPDTRREGRSVGRRAAAAILTMRRRDGSGHDDPFMGSEWVTSEEAGHWRQDPVSLIPIALGAKWGKVRPFVLHSGKQFRTPPPPPMASEAYTRAFNEAKALGGDGVTTQTDRTEEQTQIGIYWAYDGTPSLCAPPRLYNQIVETVSARSNSVIKLARLYALVNVAMADAGIAIWESKYYYDFWRPVTGIREADEDTGPTGAGDGNPATYGDTGFHATRRTREQSQRPEFHAAISRIPVRPCRIRRCTVPDLAALLR